MKGKKSVLISLMLLLVTIITVTAPAKAQTTPNIYIDPPIYYDPTKVPLTTFFVDINIADVDVSNKLYTWSLFLWWDPALLNVTTIAEGPFLQSGGPTFFIKKQNQGMGYIDLACALLGDIPGVSGSGRLARVTFLVETTGETLLDLKATSLLNDAKPAQPISHTHTDGYFGNVPAAPAELVKKSAWPERHHFDLSKHGSIQHLYARVKNLGTVQTAIKVEFSGTHDGAVWATETAECIAAAGEQPPDLSASLDVGALGANKYLGSATCMYRYYSPLLGQSIGDWTATDSKAVKFNVVPGKA